MDSAASQLETLLELDARHDDLLQRLDVLDKRVQTVLTECMTAREPASGGGGPTEDGGQDGPARGPIAPA